MKLSFITWVSNKEQYWNFMKSAKNFSAEFIAIWQEAKSLSQAYNAWTKQADWDIIVYVHQDIVIRDTKFQEILEWIFVPWNNIWFAWPVGNTVLSDKAWWDVPKDKWAGQIIQWPNEKFEKFDNQNCPAANLDWCMLCTDKRFTFPEELTWIHFLDAWMCREPLFKLRYNYCFQSYIQHLSQWKIDDSYYENMKIYQKHFNLI